MGIDQHTTPARRAPRRLRLRTLVVGLALGLALGCQGSLEDRLDEARSLQDLGALEESVGQLREILSDHPDDPEANYLLGMAQMRMGQPTLAVWPLQIARRAPGFEVQAGLALAGAYLQLDQMEVAIEAADQVLAAQPEQAEDRLSALRVRVAAQLAEKRWNDALADANRVLEIAPDDPQALAMRANALLEANRPGEAREALHEIWESASPETAQAAARAGVGLVRLYEGDLDDPEAAQRQFDELLARYPVDRTVLRFAEDYLTRHDAPERAQEVLRNAVAEAPLDLELRAWVADQMAERGNVEEGEAILVEATELDGTATSWLHLAEYRSEHGEPEEALAAMERTVELASPPSDVLLFRYADLVASNGDLVRASELAEQLSSSVYREILTGRLAFERGDYARALELLEQGLRRWPNNVGARYLAGRAAYALGDVDRALAEFKEALRVDAGATDAGVDAARLLLAQGEPRQAIAFAVQAWNALEESGDPRAGQALRVLARAQIAAGDVDKAMNTLKLLAARPQGQLPAVLEHAALLAQTRGPAAAAERISTSTLDVQAPENREALRALGQYLVEAGRVDEALARVQASLEEHPEEAVLHDIRGRVLFNAGRLEEADAAFERALELDPDLAAALEGRARVAQASDQLPRALELFDRAAEAAPDNAGMLYGGAQAALQTGDVEGAERRLRNALRVDPFHAEASNDLAWLLAERGEELDRALALAEQAARQRRTANVLDTLGWVQIRRGEAEAAVETLEEARALAPDSPSIAYRLSRALVETGETARARELLEEALASEGFPEHERAREELARLTGAES